MTKRREEKKNEQEKWKRKRKEDDESKEIRKQQRREKQEEEMRALKDTKCQMDGCRFMYNEANVQALMWFTCPCKTFFVCPTHKLEAFFDQMKKEHTESCQK